ncbi:MAG: NADH-quinone oxidoreductase subunit NuoE [Anaerolineae bacterium]|nr:NADH-quinone oxidoreductase subunit NuoE [Anaerolineae bacterium]
MLTEAEKREIEAELAHYEHKQAACIDALKIVQQHRGWVSDESLHALADFLEMTPDELDNVATFYNLIFRRPVGRHVIFVCNSVSCWIMGYEQVRQHLSERLGIAFGQTTTDGEFTLLPIQCLGTCDHAPALMIGDDLHRDVTPEQLDLLLQQYTREQAGRLEGWKTG